MSANALLPLLVFGVGTYFLIKLRFFFIIHPRKTLTTFVTTLKKREARASLSLALAGTLGVGNIFGVAAGIMIGGAGSVLWLVLSSLFAMVIKYAEAVLSFDEPLSDNSGMHAVISRVFGKWGRGLSLVYAALCVALSLFMGAAMQSAAVVDTAESALSLSPEFCAAIFSLLVFVGCVGGAKKIERITEFVIPLTTIIYIIMSFLVIFLRISSLPRVICRIFSSAFSPLAAGGGVMAFLFSNAMREGFARGILSNEAGLGTSSLAHTRARERTPHEAGLFGMCEVFFDTALLCTLTALLILLSPLDISMFSSPMVLVSAAFTAVLGEWSGAVLVGCIFLFAYSTVICWYYYGTECSSYIVANVAGLRCVRWIFPPLFFTFLLLGCGIDDRLLIFATDTVIMLICPLSLSALIKKRNRIKELSVF